MEHDAREDRVKLGRRVELLVRRGRRLIACRDVFHVTHFRLREVRQQSAEKSPPLESDRCP